jgi:DNA-binding Xre family transcriptional regulator
LLTRILKVHLGQALEAEIKKIGSKAKLANEIGVSPQTLTSMLEDDWQYITIKSIERAADYLDLKLERVFEFVTVDFWKPIREANECTFLRGSEDSNGSPVHFRVPALDRHATVQIENFLGSDLLNYRYADLKRDVEELLELARTQNCIVIGGSKSNAATEILLAKFFNAEPFDASDKNRQKIPFGFCWRDDHALVKKSSLTCSSMARKKTKNRPGIALRGGIYVPSDYLEEQDYNKSEIKSGSDSGIVFVANKPFGTTENVKLIVVAGFTGIGTVGACKALIEDYRYLEPTEKDSCVFGVVQVIFSKKANSKDRIFKKYKWIYRKGGHLPIKPDN